MEFIETEKIFDDYLLCDIEIIHMNRILRAGKLKLVTFKNNNIKFFLDTNDGSKSIELFYPLTYDKTEDYIKFGYNINDFCSIELKKLVRSLITDRSSKFLNSEIIFKKV